MIGNGRVSVAAAADLSRAHTADHGGNAPPAVLALATLGAGGAHRQNEERDLHRWVKDLYHLGMETYDVKMQLQVSRTKGSQEVFFPFSRFWVSILHLYISIYECVFIWASHVHATQVPNEEGLFDKVIPFLLPHELCHALSMAGKQQALRKLSYQTKQSFEPNLCEPCLACAVQPFDDWRVHRD